MLTRFDRSTGHARDIQVYPLFFSGMPASALKERWQWTFPIVFSPHDANVLYTSSQHLWKTTNDGQSWERISPDLTRADPKTVGDSGGPITKDQNGPEIYGTIFTIAPSRLEAKTIWTGSDDGLAYITRDGGKKWDKITPPGLPEFSRISLIEASPHKPGTSYLAARKESRSRFSTRRARLSARSRVQRTTTNGRQALAQEQQKASPSVSPRLARQRAKRELIASRGTFAIRARQCSKAWCCGALARRPDH